LNDEHLAPGRRRLTAFPPNHPIVTVTPSFNMAGKRIRCNAKECREAAQRIVGDCGFCNGHFCGKHRLLEDHKCTGLEDCKKQSHERNAAQLNAERTQVIRGV
jgi:predicted nucleic acid binding AN1-type Zn finger protein